MKRFNLELNVSKLETKKLQLKAIENQYNELASKLKEVAQRLEAKHKEVSELNTSIESYKQSVVS